MKIHNSQWLKIEICKAPQLEPFHWKGKQIPHRRSMADMRYFSHGEVYEGTHYFVTDFIQIFWLWFVIGIEIKKEQLSKSKYVRYEATHYANIDESISQGDH